MSRETPFVLGTIVEAEWLNELQEVMTGATWGLRLAQNAGLPQSVMTGVTGDTVDSMSTAVIGGQRRWLTGSSNSSSGSGSSEEKEIRLYTDIDSGDELALSRDFFLEVASPSAIPSGTYNRVIGYGDWDAGTTVLSNIRLANGVMADASQFNAFTFRTIGRGEGDTPLRLYGYDTQATSTSRLFSAGVEVTGNYNEKIYISGAGTIGAYPDAASDLVFETGLDSDTYSRHVVHGDGEHCWGDGATPLDICLSRGTSTSETLILEGATGNGIFDTIYIQNSNNTDGTLPGTVVGAVNIFDLNVIGNSYHDGVIIDLDDLAHLTGAETFTGQKTFDQTIIANNGVRATALGSVGFQRIGSNANQEGINLQVTGDINSRFYVTTGGVMTFGNGTVADVVLSRGGTDYLQLDAGDQFRVQQDPVNDNDLARKSYVDQSVESSRAFSFFIGS